MSQPSPSRFISSVLPYVYYCPVQKCKVRFGINMNTQMLFTFPYVAVPGISGHRDKTAQELNTGSNNSKCTHTAAVLVPGTRTWYWHYLWYLWFVHPDMGKWQMGSSRLKWSVLTPVLLCCTYIPGIKSYRPYNSSTRYGIFDTYVLFTMIPYECTIHCCADRCFNLISSYVVFVSCHVEKRVAGLYSSIMTPTRSRIDV